MIRILLIGAGAVAERFHCPALLHLEKAGVLQVLGVVEPSEQRARDTAARFKQARPYADCSEAFQSAAYDLAIITSPPGVHADQACAAFAAGCHVLCEKPMTTTSADADRMNAAAKHADRVLAVAHPRRFYANFADVAKLVADGGLGTDLQFTYREGGTYGWSVATGAAFVRETSGGGALADKGVHSLDQLCWILGTPAVVEFAEDDSFAGGVETNSRLKLALPRARGILHVSWEYPLNNGLRIWGSEGGVMLDGEAFRTYLRKTRAGWMRVPATTDWPADMKPRGGRRMQPNNYYICFEAQLIAMLRCITYGEPFPVTGVQAASVQATIDQAYKMVVPMCSPWLSDAEQIAARAMHWKEQQVR